MEGRACAVRADVVPACQVSSVPVPDPENPLTTKNSLAQNVRRAEV